MFLVRSLSSSSILLLPFFSFPASPFLLLNFSLHPVVLAWNQTLPLSHHAIIIHHRTPYLSPTHTSNSWSRALRLWYSGSLDCYSRSEGKDMFWGEGRMSIRRGGEDDGI